MFSGFGQVNSDMLVITIFLSSETRGNPNSIGVTEETIADRNSFSGYSVSASHQSRDMQLNGLLRHSATGTKDPTPEPSSLTASDSDLLYVYDTYILPHLFDFAGHFHGLYVARWRNVLSSMN